MPNQGGSHLKALKTAWPLHYFTHISTYFLHQAVIPRKLYTSSTTVRRRNIIALVDWKDMNLFLHLIHLLGCEQSLLNGFRTCRTNKKGNCSAKLTRQPAVAVRKVAKGDWGEAVNVLILYKILVALTFLPSPWRLGWPECCLPPIRLSVVSGVNQIFPENCLNRTESTQ